MAMDRRTVLKGALTGLGAAALPGALPGCDPTVTPIGLTPAVLRTRIKTVVVLMMENRSFDHVFGSLSLLEGRDDVDGLAATMQNPRSDGRPVLVAPADQNCVADPGHGWNASHAQFADGANDGFVRVHEERAGAEAAHRVMGYLQRRQQPASYALADQFALCQRWHASVMGPTWPNRYYSQWATSDGQQSNDLVSAPLPTIYGRLDKAGIGWSSYYGNLPFSSIFPNHSLEADEYQHLDQFFEDAEAGKLRSLVWIDPVYGRNDDHPPAHPMAGQLLIASVYEALRKSPQWDECLLLITYDEHGGFFDHVPPGTVEDTHADTGMDQLGFRVPALVVGPYVRPQVSSTLFDHTSLISTVLRLHELEPLNVRDDTANDVFGLLDVERLVAQKPRQGQKLPVIIATDDELYAPGCASGLLFHRSVDGAAVAALDAGFTGQPELERAFQEKYGANHPKDLRRHTGRVMHLLTERARALGVVR